MEKSHQVAQGAQAGDERAAFEATLDPSLSRETFVDEEGDTVYRYPWVQGAWIGWNRRAATATQPAAGEPKQQTAINAADLPTKKYPLGAFDFDSPAAAPVAAEGPLTGKRLYGMYTGPSDYQFDKWSVVKDQHDDWNRLAGRLNAMMAAPPAAAHGDEALRKMVLPERIDRRQYLGGRGDAVAQGWNDCLNWIDKANAMRAQGDGGAA